MLLAVDTSTAQLGLALYDGVTVTAELTWISRARHTVELAPALAGLLDRTGFSVKDLAALGVALGPGSFTSLRVGLSFMKGLALARHLPLIGVPTMDAVAAGVPLQDLPLAVVLQAGRGRIAVNWYKASKNGWQAGSSIKTTNADALADSIRHPTLIVGELTAADRQRLERKRKNIKLASPAQSVRRPALLAELAWERWKAGQVNDVASLAPIYLHTAGGPS